MCNKLVKINIVLAVGDGAIAQSRFALGAAVTQALQPDQLFVTSGLQSSCIRYCTQRANQQQFAATQARVCGCLSFTCRSVHRRFSSCMQLISHPT